MRELSTAAATLADRLRAELLDGALPPGTRLKEEELAERFGAGRYTVRSALRTLVASGLLEHELNRGARVPHLLPARVDELYAYRTVLEVGALRLAQSQGEPLALVEQTTAALVELPDDTPWPEVIGVHQDIHRAIVRWSGNNRLLEAYALCEQELAFVVASTRPNYTARQLADLHTRLLDQLRLGGQRAASALTRDIETGRRAVHEAMHTETDKVG
ncbi:MAG TPA: GntR family transcriptional regulator [Pseudonocardiaceae bacterium]|jgi:DNA-binding GntR family transcriptional regulator